jgi:hypothetical protein
LPLGGQIGQAGAGRWIEGAVRVQQKVDVTKREIKEKDNGTE